MSLQALEMYIFHTLLPFYRQNNELKKIINTIINNKDNLLLQFYKAVIAIRDVRYINLHLSTSDWYKSKTEKTNYNNFTFF